MPVSALGDPQVCGNLGAFASIYVLPGCDWSAQVAREIVFRPLNPMCSAFWYSSYDSKIPFSVLNVSPGVSLGGAVLGGLGHLGPSPPFLPGKEEPVCPVGHGP